MRIAIVCRRNKRLMRLKIGGKLTGWEGLQALFAASNWLYPSRGALSGRD